MLQIIKMLMTIVILFALCWLPLYSYLVLGMVLPEHVFVNNQEIFYTFYFAGLWLAMANSFINPIVYAFLNDGFRVSLKFVSGREKRSIFPALPVHVQNTRHIDNDDVT